MDKYDTAQICLNGHVVNSHVHEQPEDCQKYCAKCGEETVTTCSDCNAHIRGDLFEVAGFMDSAPAYCQNCGGEFVWTRRRIKTAIELASEDETLTSEDVEQVEESMNEVIRETPRSQLGASRLRKLFGKMKQETANAIRDIVVDVLSEAAKKSIWP